MDDADQELETGVESIYDRVRGPLEGLYLNRVVTQNYLQSQHDHCGFAAIIPFAAFIADLGFDTGLLAESCHLVRAAVNAQFLKIGMEFTVAIGTSAFHPQCFNVAISRSLCCVRADLGALSQA